MLSVFFTSVLLFLGSLFENVLGANFCFWVSVLVLRFLVGFCLCFCFYIWRFAPESVWTNSLDVKSVVFWVRSLFLSLFFSSSSFFLFKRQRSGSNRTPPHAPLCFFPFSFCVPPRLLFRPFWPCVLLSWLFLGVPFWAPRVFRIFSERWGLELARPF